MGRIPGIAEEKLLSISVCEVGKKAEEQDFEITRFLKSSPKEEGLIDDNEFILNGAKLIAQRCCGMELEEFIDYHIRNSDYAKLITTGIENPQKNGILLSIGLISLVRALNQFPSNVIVNANVKDVGKLSNLYGRACCIITALKKSLS